MLVASPAIALDAVVLEVLQRSSGEGRTLGDDFGTGIVLDTLTLLVFGEFKELVNEDILQVLILCLVFLVNLGQNNLVLLLGLTGLDGTREELLVDNHTAE